MVLTNKLITSIVAWPKQIFLLCWYAGAVEKHCKLFYFFSYLFLTLLQNRKKELSASQGLRLLQMLVRTDGLMLTVAVAGTMVSPWLALPTGEPVVGPHYL